MPLSPADTDLALTGLEGVGHCAPGECTSHRIHHSDRRSSSRPTDRDKSGQRASFLHREQGLVNVERDSLATQTGMVIPKTFQKSVLMLLDLTKGISLLLTSDR